MPRIDIESLEDEWEEDHHLLSQRRRSDPLSQAAKDRIEDYDEGRIVAVDKGQVRVLFEGEILPARFSGAMRGTKLVVGDRVRVRPPRHETDEARIVELLARETVLLRTADDALDDERVVVANADTVAVVLAADYLDVGTRFLDRVMVAASVGGMDTVLCINKVDLVEDRSTVAEVAARYEAMGVRVEVTSAETGEGLDALAQVLTGCWTTFTGHSGVGKTSLFNRLVPEAGRAVGEIGRFGGRHTTVSARAMLIPALDAWLVDTPGVRSFGLGTLRPEELADHFPELAALDCGLDDCLHEGEPGCVLRDTTLHPARLESYRRLLAALREAA
ncbi:ribosome small subunit-dependent GTPase A [Egicoccus halophilus]|uniref:Small ribosomal subunit biogenesis GTPase RsgA n=1 Tax=Egicoccus halophilus TaxID=1670830 RepID=A0A8J3A712_9ACTN|nr:ribosome small subunit-dependent GTPase A [Egicoccus halophilus]GGI05216.1 putative ribosome biogenesis GTPase RsgA [Egicoccus halophilus]